MRLTISLDDDLYAFVKQRSRADDLSMSAVIAEILRRAKEPVLEPLRVLEVRNGIRAYGRPGEGIDPKLDLVKLGKQLEEEEDLERLRRGGFIK